MAALTTLCLVLNLTAPVLAQTLPVAPTANPQGQTPTVTPAPNSNVPVVDITTPNDAGVSHNVYSDFNVGPEGMVFNNSTTGDEVSQITGTQLGANSNLTNGSASLILNEVTGGNISQLLGYMEVYGQSADFVIANPNGITCNGCGFYNTPRVTLTTGTPIWGDNGSLDGFDVNGGKITIGDPNATTSSLGADVTRVDFFDIVARSIQISGLIEGNTSSTEIGLFAGRNTYNYSSHTVTPKADDGSDKPEFGIDSTLFGGAYANKITIIGTENGVGVRTPTDMRAAYGGISLTADGKIVFGKTRSQGRIKATSHSSNIEIAQQVWSETALELTAGGNISVLDNIKAGAKGNVTLAADSLDLNAGALVGAGMNEDGTFVSGGLLTIEAAALTNRGTLQSGRNINITVTGTTTNSGDILADGTLALLGGSLFYNEASGAISGNDGVQLNVASGSNSGSISSSSGDVTATASGDLTNSGAVEGQNVALSADGLIANQAGGSITSNTKTSVTAGSLSNDGTLSSDGQLVADVAGDLTNTAQMTAGQDANITVGGTLTNELGAEIRAAGVLTIDANSLQNIGAIDEAVTDGLITAQDIVISGGEVINAGDLLADNDLTITVTGSASNVLGQMIAGGDIDVNADDRFENLSGVVRGANVAIDANEIINVTLVKRDGEVIIPEEFEVVFRTDTIQKIDQAVKDYQTAVSEKWGLAEEKLFDALREQLGEEALTDEIKNKIRTLLQENNNAEGADASANVTQNVALAVRAALFRNSTSGQLSRDISQALGGTFLRNQDTTAAENAVIAELQKIFKDNPNLDAVEDKVRTVLVEVFKTNASANQAEKRIIAAVKEGLNANKGSASNAFSVLRGRTTADAAATSNSINTKQKSGLFSGLIKNLQAANDNHTDTSAGTAEISATNNVKLKAKGDVTDVGGKTTAGGDVTIKAGGNVNMSAQQLSMVNNQGISGGHDNHSSITNLRSELEAGGDITITAGEDARLKGVGVTSGGDATLRAKGDVELSGVKDEKHKDYKKKKSGFLGFNKKETVNKSDEYTTVQT
ncbi:MAG: filamentous hemagglutinin N-terminal domain-containing protein, partial [Alphaproteobacteria bacterium]